jgi:hypothetical protein
MALPDVGRVQSGTAKSAKSSGGDSTITLASLANAAARQGTKIDLGATRAREYDVFLDVEMAATPTAGNPVQVYWAPSSSATAGTDNPGNVTGTDAAYSGYSSNLDATLPQLQLAGELVLTAQATTTVQKGYCGRFSPAQRYGSPVIVNRGGSAFHSSDTNMQLRLVPVEDVIEDT